jgi:translocation and assembly module TamB
VLVDLSSPDLKIGLDQAYDTAKVHLAGKGAGSLDVEASGMILWEDGLKPLPDTDRPATAKLSADKFRVNALLPFVAGALSRLDGRLNGSVTAAFGKLGDPKHGKLTGGLDFTDGVLNVPQLGQELHDAGVSIKAMDDGTIHIDDLRARGTKGGLTGSGRVLLSGLSFLRANATMEIKNGDDLPLTLEGVPLGDARGEITVDAEQKNGEIAIDVGIPHLHVDLPAAIGRGVQSLDANPDIQIAPGAPKVKELAPVGGNKLAVTFHIGSIEIAGNMLDFALTGSKSAPLQVEISDKAKVSGDIHMTRGRIELLHKQFEIEQGTIHLRPEDPSNPYVNVKARWDSPDGTIYVEYVGLLLPVTTEKLKYSSPTIPEDQVLATLLFGGEQQSTLGSGQGGAPVPGQSLATQLLAQQFSTQISSNISTSIGTGDDGSIRPGLKYTSGDKEVEVSTYEGTAQGSSASGSAAAKSQRTLITLDWRFWHNWLVRGKVDAGSDQTVTGVDLLWQYRY